MSDIVCIDIGSTYTKGALFRRAADRLELAAYSSQPTTVERLADGFAAVAEDLSPSWRDADLAYSSSAKGGLAVAAIGVVPALTMRMAKEAALSAGAKISRVDSYKLTTADIDAIVASDPDIVLLTGGIDGGDEAHVLHNAQRLGASSLRAPVIYAGNRCVVDEIRKLLSGHDCRIAGNVLPEIDAPDPESAREAIRDVFLEVIAAGKGLDEIIKETGAEPRPTPLAMLEFAQLFRKNASDFGDFCLVDLGGATTDVYSDCDPEPESGVLVKGLAEPPVKRTVEGDLGMRVGAAAAVEATKDYMIMRLTEEGIDAEGIPAFGEMLTGDPAIVLEDETDLRCEEILAEACVATALARHAGTREQVYTADGQRAIIRGRDLRKVRSLIGSGGYLARNPLRPSNSLDSFRISDDGKERLLPTDFEFLCDAQYTWPLLASAAVFQPEAAVAAAVAGLQSVLVEA